MGAVRAKDRRGVAMMYALLIVMIAAVIGLSYAASQSTSIHLARNINDRARARHVAESGLEFALGYIRSDNNWRSEQSEGLWVQDVALADGTFTVYGYDGIDSNGDGIVDGDGSLADDMSDLFTLIVSGSVNGVTCPIRLTVTPVQESGSAILLIVTDPVNMTAEETALKLLLESFDYDVALLAEDATQEDIDSALEKARMVYLASTVNANKVGTRLNATSLGIVSESRLMADKLMLATNAAGGNGTQIDLVDTSHDITFGFPQAPLTIYSSKNSLVRYRGTLAPGLQVLAESGKGGSASATLAAIEKSEALIGGSPAAGRRVLLPWGQSGFDPSTLNADGTLLLQRALEWAMYDDDISDDHLVAHWKLDGDAVDATGNGFDGINVGAEVYELGRLDSAMHFTGTDYIRVEHSPGLNLTDVISITG